MGLRRNTLAFVRRLVGLNHIDARFDALETLFGQTPYALSARLDALEPQFAEMHDEASASSSFLKRTHDITETWAESIKTDVDEIVNLLDYYDPKGSSLDPTTTRLAIIEECRRVILYNGRPQRNHILENRSPFVREIATCRALSEDALFIFGFARSSTSITLDLINYSNPRALLTGESNFYLPKHIKDFQEWYEGHVKIQGNQVGKSFHVPTLLSKRRTEWWEYLLALREFYSIVGDKMALTSVHFNEMRAQDIRRFFEERFFKSRYIFLFRNPIQTMLSWAKLANISTDEEMKNEIVAWLMYIQLWADIVRVFPRTITLIAEELGHDAKNRLAEFVGFSLLDGFFDSKYQNKMEISRGFPILLELKDELVEIFEMVRAVSMTKQPLWRANRKHVIASDSTFPSAILSSMKDEPISEPWSRADALCRRLRPEAPEQYV